MVGAGQLSDRITIQQRVDTRNEYGAMVSAWEKRCEPYCRTTWLNGSKSLKIGELVTVERISFTIRAQYSIDTTDRILYRGKKYAIVSICNNRNDSAIELIGEVINE